MPSRPGRIITFYSYKGGTGRTMALANVAWILASNGKRVLAVDWDLEAPGLHRYFRPFLLDQDLTSSSGVIDIMWAFAKATVSPIDDPQEVEDDWHEDYSDILRHVVALRWSFRKPGRLDLLPPGLQGPSYAARVNSFNWQNFYTRLGGGVFLESVKARMKEEYDYILIDSRTGVSDTSGICTVQMPDDLVVCFTANHQSIEGALAVAASIRKQWSETREQGKEGRIFPVLMRSESGELAKLTLARQEARSRFASFVDFLPSDGQEEYWGAVETPYIPWYAFEEVLAPFVDEPKTLNSVLGAAERLTSCLTDGAVTSTLSPRPEERAQILNQYLRDGRFAPMEQTPPVPPAPSEKPLEETAPTPPIPSEESFGLSFQETQTDLPSLFLFGTFWNPGEWSLPVSSLSAFSAAVFLVSFGVLQSTAGIRSSFVLPQAALFILGLISTGLAWIIAFSGSHRPGWLWPRVWALSLALLTSTTLLLTFFFAKSSWLSSLVGAGLASTTTLSLRLLKIGPASAWLPYVSLLGLLSGFISLFGIWALAQWIIGSSLHF